MAATSFPWNRGAAGISPAEVIISEEACENWNLQSRYLLHNCSHPYSDFSPLVHSFHVFMYFVHSNNISLQSVQSFEFVAHNGEFAILQVTIHYSE